MNQDRFEGICKQISGRVKEAWCKLTGDVPGAAAARRGQRDGWNQEGRGVLKETATRQLEEFRVRNRDWDLTDR